MSAKLPQDQEVVLPPEEGYDLASSWYDNWHWTKFWLRNELPITTALFERLPIGNALDAGSGTGLYRFALEARGHRTVGIDISKKMLEVQARKETRAEHQANLQLVHGDIQGMPVAWSAAFDHVCCARVLSHIDDYELAIKELCQM
jgi:ubiquinone/menaquinone biosynthesis C-methylase UbiE